MFPFGADAKELLVESPRPELLQLPVGYMEFVAALEALPKPTLAALQLLRDCQ